MTEEFPKSRAERQRAQYKVAFEGKEEALSALRAAKEKAVRAEEEYERVLKEATEVAEDPEVQAEAYEMHKSLLEREIRDALRRGDEKTAREAFDQALLISRREQEEPRWIGLKDAVDKALTTPAVKKWVGVDTEKHRNAMYAWARKAIRDGFSDEAIIQAIPKRLKIRHEEWVPA